MADRPKRITEAPEAVVAKAIREGARDIAQAITEALGPRVEMKIVHDEVPPLLDSIRHIKLSPGDAERFGGHDLIGRDDLEKISPFYETEGQKLKRLLAEIRARVLILSGYREEDDPSAGDVAQNELAVERTDTVMAFFDLAQGHPLPRKLLPRGDRLGDRLPPGTPVVVHLGGFEHPAVVEPTRDTVTVRLTKANVVTEYPRDLISKEGEPWIPPKPIAS